MNKQDKFCLLNLMLFYSQKDKTTFYYDFNNFCI